MSSKTFLYFILSMSDVVLVDGLGKEDVKCSGH
jgi:hypothetical protein